MYQSISTYGLFVDNISCMKREYKFDLTKKIRNPKVVMWRYYATMLTKAQLKRRIKKFIAIFYRIKLKNRNFSILSNNCWGGVVYDKYALPYYTPTIGLWIPPADYCRFLNNIKHYIENDIKQIHYNESHVADLLLKRKQEGRYNFDLDSLILGRIDDVDIVFIHYQTFAEAKEKWNRRKKRINFNNLLVKMNDQNDCTEDDYKQFCNLPFENKLFFTANKNWTTDPCVLYFSQYKSDGYVVNDTIHGSVPLNVTAYLNKMIKKER